MRFRRNRHEGIGQAGFGIEFLLQFPFAPAVVVLGYGQAKRNVWLRRCELLIAPFVRKKSSQECVIRLANDEKSLATPAFFFHQYHAEVLDRGLSTYQH